MPSASLPVFSTSATRPSSSPTIRSRSPSSSQSIAVGAIICRSIASGWPVGVCQPPAGGVRGSRRVPTFSK